MAVDEAQERSARDRILQKRFRLAGLIIVIVGLLAAVAISRWAAADAGGSDADILGDSKRYDYAMERIGGRSNALASELREWFAGLWHGRKLARTVVVLSVVGSLGCFLVAHLYSFSLPPDDRTGGNEG
jgi:hypothetical protein